MLTPTYASTSRVYIGEEVDFDFLETEKEEVYKSDDDVEDMNGNLDDLTYQNDDFYCMEFDLFVIFSFIYFDFT